MICDKSHNEMQGIFIILHHSDNLIQNVLSAINNILTPIDFSEYSLRALEYAIEIAKKTNATLHIIHAYRLIQPNNLSIHSLGIELKKHLENTLNQKFNELEFEYLANQPIEYEITLEVGFALDVVQTTITDKKIELVIMGTRGNRELEEIFGSTTWSVIKSTTCPVLAVPKEAAFDSIKHITLANESQSNDDTINWSIVKEIAHSFHTEVMILKCQPEKRMLMNVVQRNTSFYHDLFKSLKISQLLCNRETFINGIKKQLDHCNSDLLVLISKENILPESYFKRDNTKEIILDTKIPILMIQKALI